MIKRQTFIFLKRVITPTASLESGTGDPIPISSPVSRGRSLLLVLPSLSVRKDSGLPPIFVNSSK